MTTFRHPDWPRAYGRDDVTISIERPVVEKPGPNFVIEYEPGPVMTVTIEGSAEKVKPFADVVVAIARAVEELR